MNSSGDSSESPEKGSADSPGVERFRLEHVGRVVGLTDPRISPDGGSIVVRVSRVNYDENRFDIELVKVDVATGAQRVLTQECSSGARTPSPKPRHRGPVTGVPSPGVERIA